MSNPNSIVRQPPGERPIFIAYPQRRVHHHYEGDGSDSTYERRPYARREVWIQDDQIPATPPAPAPFPGNIAGVVSGISGVVLAAVPGAPTQFQNLAQFTDMVPATYALGAYQPSLQDSQGRPVPYNPSVWVADGLRQRIEFPYGVPSGLKPPFTITYWRYVGTFPTDGVSPGPPVPDTLELYVSAAGNDAGAGTLASPYLTLDRALDDVRTFGWNLTAEIRILSTGGIYSWPRTLNVNAGGRGRQRSPIAFRGYNTNPNPGRTLVFSQAVTSASADPTSQIVTVVGPGPYAAAQIGQRIRFTSGPLASAPVGPFGLGSVAVDVPIVAVPNATTLVIAWAPTPPDPGDTFVIEALDTRVTTGTALAAIRDADRFSLVDLVASSSPLTLGGLFVEDSALVQLSAFHVVSSGLFLLSGYLGATFVGGDTLGSLDATGIAPTTTSLFVNSGGLGQFLTALTEEPEFATFSLQYAGLLGAGSALSLTGALSKSYANGFTVQATAGTSGSVGNLWSNNGVVQATRGGHLTLSAARITAGLLSATREGTLDYSNVLIDASAMSLDSGAVASGTALSFAGASGSPLLALNGGSLMDHQDSLVMTPADTFPITLTGRSCLVVEADLTSSGFNAPGRSGVALSEGSELVVRGALTVDGNGSSGLSLTQGSKFTCGGSLSAQNNSTFGLSLTGAQGTVNAVTTITGSSQGLFLAGSAFTTGVLNSSSNLGANIFLIAGSLLVAGPTTANVTIDGDETSVFLTGGSRFEVGTLSALNATGSCIGIFQGSALASNDTVFANGSTSAVAGVHVSGNSSLSIANNLTASTHATANGVLVEFGSTLAVGGSLQASNNGIDGLHVTQNATASAGTTTCNSNTGSGIHVETGGKFAGGPTTIIQCALNGADGITVATQGLLFGNQFESAAGNNTGFGLQTLSSGRVQTSTPGVSAMAGAGGQVKVGVNAAATWANIATGNPAFITDYLSAQNPTQLCSVS
jgi:hypothetical protein